jgi:hypothetical protein
MNPTSIQISLDEITTGYAVFETDQVLTADQLNTVPNYADDQERLTRIKLLGVGIVCGLHVSLSGDIVTVTKGAGITTDGDILHLPVDTQYNQFKEYDGSNPLYRWISNGVTHTPFNQKGVTVYELIEKSSEETATPFSKFDRGSLDNMVAVLFMESYRTSDDLCSGGDCDNLGDAFVNNVRLLLIKSSALDGLKESVATPDQATSNLEPVVADRPLITSEISSVNELYKLYLDACKAISKNLVAQFGALSASGESFFGDVFSAGLAKTVKGWLARLTALQASFTRNSSGIQYYYDFLKDLVETWNSFRDLGFGETTWCCPDRNAFPKHLLLGNLMSGAGSEANRTSLYPSPLTSQTNEELSHAKFLVQKLDTMIQAFELPKLADSAKDQIRVTPSRFEDESLENRAIPYYYQVNTTDPIEKNWSFALHERDMDAYIYSYNAAAYRAKGGAADPLVFQIGCFSFFRIEGHLGQNVSTAAAAIQSDITEYNLPIALRSVLLDSDKTKLLIKPDIGYTDLHRLHYLLRQDAADQLDEVSKFSGTFTAEVNDAIANKVIVTKAVTDVPGTDDATYVQGVVQREGPIVAASAASAKETLQNNYASFSADSSWKNNSFKTLAAASTLKSDLSQVVTTDFPTPFDSLISSRSLNLVDWLDVIIKQKSEQENERLLFTRFISEHAGLEHFGGVTRGGTFVLVYDTSNKVIADFMLPYICCEATTKAPEEPTLQKGDWPDWNANSGLRVTPSLDYVFSNKLQRFKEVEIDPKIQLLQNISPVTETVAIKNDFTRAKVSEFKAQQEALTYLQKQFDVATTDVERQGLQKKIDEQELQSANTATEIADSVASAKAIGMSTNDIELATTALSEGTVNFKSSAALTVIKKGLSAAGAKADNPTAKAGLNKISARIA